MPIPLDCGSSKIQLRLFRSRPSPIKPNAPMTLPSAEHTSYPLSLASRNLSYTSRSFGAKKSGHSSRRTGSGNRLYAWQSRAGTLCPGPSVSSCRLRTMIPAYSSPSSKTIRWDGQCPIPLYRRACPLPACRGHSTFQALLQPLWLRRPDIPRA